ncbi:MAG: nucleoid-associated protein [Bermanella sp.]
MPVTHFVCHQIQKDSQLPGAKVTLCDTSAELDDYSQRVMSQLRSIFVQRASKRYGRFNPELTTFKALTLDWLRGGQTFNSWSQKVANMYADQMDNTSLEIDGYLAFIREEVADADRLYIFHLREKSNVAFNSNMELTETRFIDFSNTGFALCLDTSELLNDGQQEYLTFCYGRGDKAVQKLFSEFCGFSDTINTEQDTEEFLQIVEAYTATMPEEEANQTRTSIVDYCVEQDKHGEAVGFKVLSSQLNDQAPEKFEQFVIQKREQNRLNSAISAADQTPASTPPVAKSEFIPDRKSLKNYIRYSGKNKDVTLSFAAAALGSDVSFDATNNALTIKNLPNRLLKQLQRANGLDS